MSAFHRGLKFLAIGSVITLAGDYRVSAETVELRVRATTQSPGGLNAVAPGDAVRFEVGVAVDPAGAGGNRGLATIVYDVVGFEAGLQGLTLNPVDDALSGYSSDFLLGRVRTRFYFEGVGSCLCSNYGGGWGFDRSGLPGGGVVSGNPGSVVGAGVAAPFSYVADQNSPIPGLQPATRLDVGVGTYTFPADDPIAGDLQGGFGQEFINEINTIEGDGTWLMQEGVLDTTGWQPRSYTFQLNPTSAWVFDDSLDYTNNIGSGFRVGASDSMAGTSFSFVVRQTTDCNNNGTHDDDDIAQGTSPDCNQTGIPDQCDLASGVSRDFNGNAVPDECELSGCACADLSGDGLVTLLDYASFALCFGLGAPTDGCRPAKFVCVDLDNNGLVNLVDFASFALLFGRPPAGNPPFCLDVDRDGISGPGGTDCNDADPGTHPGATELCYDGVDNDCDGLTDLGDTADCLGCPFACGDLQGDGSVNVVDFSSFALCFGKSPSSSQACACSDFNGDAVIDPIDQAIFAATFGQPASGSIPNCQ